MSMTRILNQVRRTQEKNASVKARGIEALLGGAAGAAGGAYGEKKTRKTVQYRDEQGNVHSQKITSPERKLKTIGASALLGATGSLTASKIKRLRQQGFNKKQVETLVNSMTAEKKRIKDALDKKKLLDPTRGAKKRELDAATEFERKFKSNKDEAISRANKNMNARAFGGGAYQKLVGPDRKVVKAPGKGSGTGQFIVLNDFAGPSSWFKDTKDGIPEYYKRLVRDKANTKGSV